MVVLMAFLALCVVTGSKIVSFPASEPAISQTTNDSAQETTGKPSVEACDGAVFHEACVHTGEIVTFGNYFQSNNETKEPIEWRVLDIDKDNKKMLLLSEYVLDTKQYYPRYYSTSWETCPLRSWLNGDFMNVAFNDSERQQIVLTHLENPFISETGAPATNDTNDNVFLLSLSDVNNSSYFGSNVERSAVGTSYAIRYANGHDYSDSFFVSKPSGVSECENIQCSIKWWLRSPGEDLFYAAYIENDGVVEPWGDMPLFPFGVRPAIWVQYAPKQPASAVSCTASETSMLVSPKGEEIIFPKCILHIGDSVFGCSYEHESGCRLSAAFVDDIINKGLDVNQYNEYGDTPLMLATDVDSVNKLIKAGADVNHKNFYGNSALDYAASPEIVRAILQTGKCHIKELNEHLLVDVMENRPDIFRELIASGIVDLENDSYTLFRYANSVEVVQILLDAGAELNYKLDYGGDIVEENIWDIAKFYSPEMIKLIVDSGKCTSHAPMNLDEILKHTTRDALIGLYEYVFDDETKRSVAVSVMADVSITCQRCGETGLNLDKILSQKGISGLFEQEDACIRKAIRDSDDNDSDDSEVVSDDGDIPNNSHENMTGSCMDTDCKYIVYRDDLNGDCTYCIDDDCTGCDCDFCELEVGNIINRERSREENPYKDKIFGTTDEIWGNDDDFDDDYFEGFKLESNRMWSDGDDGTGLRYRDDRYIRTWLAKGGDVNARDRKGRTVLFYVKMAKEVRILLAAGADINAKDNNGNTPLLHFEREYSKHGDSSEIYFREIAYSEIISALLNAGADKTVVNKDGKSMQDYENERPERYRIEF